MMTATQTRQFVSPGNLAKLQPAPGGRLDPAKRTVDLSIVQFLNKERQRLPQLSAACDCQAGEIIFQEGDPGDAMYIILSGQVAVIKGSFEAPIILGYRVSGESLGEMALLEDQPRSASVIAISPVQLQMITQEDFSQLMVISPQMSLSMMKMLSARLRESSSNIYRLGQMVDNLHNDMSGLQQAQEALRLANEQLTAQLAEVCLLEARLKEMAIRDALTGLYNRRYLEETLERELERAGRDVYPLSLILMDIDHFKRLNDTYGHPAGDQVLRELARLLQSHTRRGDVACRYGGEEFVIILPGADLETTCQRAETLRRAFEEMCIEYEGQTLRATLSLGVAAYPVHGSQPANIIQAADIALYTAKKSGRNQVTACEG